MKSYLFELNVDDLKDSEKIFLWSIREWLICIRLAKNPRKLLIDLMNKCRIQNAEMPLDKIMRTLAYYSSTPIHIRCHCSEQIGKNEIDLLCLLSIKQSQIVFKINKIIKYLKEDHLIQLNDSCRKLIEYFNEANLFFPVRKDLIASYNIFNQSKDTMIYFDFKNKTLH
ncbi:hypothetical protein N8014_05045 [Pseudomonadota bacterium]|nr:hypothetical protein [Pseudomonadota bacterium]